MPNGYVAGTISVAPTYAFTLDTLQLSDVAGKPSATVVVQLPVPSSLVFALVIFAGHVIDGGVTSTLFTVKLQVLVLLLASFAVSVTVTVPVPLAAVPAIGDWVTVTGLHASLAVASDI